MLNVRLPARINLAGSPTDAVEGAYATITAAVELHGGARIAPADDRIELRRSDGSSATFSPSYIEDAGEMAVEAAAINGLLRHAPELASRLHRQGAVIETWTEIPRSSGMAGSSVLLLAVLAALRAFYDLDRRRYNDYVLAELAQRIEELDLGIVCGFADRYAPLFGDIAYLSYHGKLWHAPLAEEPFVTYEKLGDYLPALELCVATTGVQRHSGSVHAPMRQRYLRERRGGKGPLLELARQLGETAWRGKIALLSGDLAAFGAQIDRNQRLVDEMMHACGFEEGAGHEVRMLVGAAKAAGALGAKLTGAGGGGAIFALPPPGGADAVAAALRKAASAAGLTGSAVLIVPVSRRGLQIEVAPN
jgi:galactokinase/mevalonate kinase-like predicted kinase